MSEQTSFKQQYGPWVLIAGASHGVGAAFARSLARQGLHCVLVARRESALQALAEELVDAYAVQVLVIAEDLSQAEVAGRIKARIAERDIGLLVYNAGGDPYLTRFLASSIEDWSALLRLNSQTVMEACHLFGQPMLERQRGGVILVGSQAALGGIRKLAMYCATKAFMLNLGEALWAEWKDRGVHVLNLLIGTVDTPTMRDAMVRLGVADALTMALPSAEDIVAEALRQLPHGPTFIHPEDTRDGGQAGQARRAHVLEKTAEAAVFIGTD